MGWFETEVKLKTKSVAIENMLHNFNLKIFEEKGGHVTL